MITGKCCRNEQHNVHIECTTVPHISDQIHEIKIKTKRDKSLSTLPTLPKTKYVTMIYAHTVL